MDVHSKLFEELLQLASNLPLSRSERERKIQWCGTGQVIAMARQASGAIELFLVGAELVAHSTLVRRHLKHEEWMRESGGSFAANRLVFPGEEYFLAATAFLAEELLRCGANQDLLQSFGQCEPLIERFLQRISLSEDAILGLLGELRLLQAYLVNAAQSDKAKIVDAWRGAERSARDFVFPGRGVEVKSTRSDASMHRISSPWQVNPRVDDSGNPIEELYLVSFGFAPSEDGAGLTIASQVDVVLDLLGPPIGSRTTLQQLFLDKVAAYGGGPAEGAYDHDEMKSWAPYNRPWAGRFVRIYDLCDPTVMVLRPSDISQRPHVIPESVSFSINLPEELPGGLNPTVDLLSFAATY